MSSSLKAAKALSACTMPGLLASLTSLNWWDVAWTNGNNPWTNRKDHWTHWVMIKV